MATQTVERQPELKDNNVGTPVIASVEVLTHLRPDPQRDGVLGRTARHMGQGILAAFLTRIKRSGRDSTSKQRPRAVGVLLADWEYLTNVAARTQGDFWTRLLVGDGQGSRRGWY